MTEFLKYKKFGSYHFKQYRDKNTKYSRHATIVKKWVQEDNVLDVGAGDGLITLLLNAKGIDNEPIAVELAQKHDADVILGSAYELPFEDESFDAVFCGDVLEHLPEYEKALQEIKRVTKKYLYLVTPTKGTQNDPYHIQEWTIDELIELVEKNGFKFLGGGECRENKRIYAKCEKV